MKVEVKVKVKVSTLLQRSFSVQWSRAMIDCSGRVVECNGRVFGLHCYFCLLRALIGGAGFCHWYLKTPG